MRVLLINTPSDFLINDRVFPPLGLGYIYSALKQRGFDVDYLDISSMSDVLGMRVRDYDVVGITMTTPQAPQAAVIAKHIRDTRSGDRPLIVGGGCGIVSLGIDQGQFDVLYHGEGEEGFPDFLDKLKAKPSIYPIGSGVLQVNGEKTPDVNLIPYPDRSLFKSYKYLIDGHLTTTMITTRGCPMACLTGDTLVNTIYGNIPIKELAEKECVMPIYTFAIKEEEIFSSKGIEFKKYGTDQMVLRIEFDDKSFIDCTPDHQFLIIRTWTFPGQGSYIAVQAHNLFYGMSVVTRDKKYRKVENISVLPERQDVYCGTVPATGWFFANNVLVKNCSFCEEGPNMSTRKRSIENIIGEIDEVRQMGYRGIMFFDDIFTIQRERVKAVGEYLQSHDMVYRAFTHVKMAAKAAPILASTGCREVGIGIESGDPGILKTIHKNFSPDEALAAIRALKDHGIRVKAFFMVGLPGESPESIENTRKFLLQAQPDDLDFSIYIPFPGTEIWDNKENLDIAWDESDVRTFYKGKPGEYKAVTRTSKMSSEDLVNARDSLEKEFKVWA